MHPKFRHLISIDRIFVQNNPAEEKARSDLTLVG
jgi:hypothetical protein